MSEGIQWIKKRKGRKEGKKTGEKESNRERKRKGRERKKIEIFPMFRRSELDGLRRKVDPHIATYAWVSKFWSFIKLHEVGNFPTWNIFSLKAM